MKRIEQDGRVIWRFGSWWRPRDLEIGVEAAGWIDGKSRLEFPLARFRMTRVWGLGVAEEGWESDSGTVGLLLTGGTTIELGDGPRRRLGEAAKELSRDLHGRGPAKRTGGRPRGRS